MRTVSAATTSQWRSGDYVGPNKPMVRATIQSLHVLGTSAGDDLFTSAVFGQHAVPVELPNLKSVKWSRSTETDAATMEMVLYNTAMLPLGEAPQVDEEFGIPGFYSFARGVKAFTQTRWGQTKNAWHDRLVPDRVIKTFEGYGFDPTVIPEKDPHLYLSGFWKIDDVIYDNKGLITVRCRDLASLLLDQITFPPVIPWKRYPLSFETIHTVSQQTVSEISSGSLTWRRPSFDDSSNTPWVGKYTDLYGHHPVDAFDVSDASYWLSIGNALPAADYSFEWIQGKMAASTVQAVRFHAWGGPYRWYLSVKTAKGWLGAGEIPYNPNDPIAFPNGADIRYVTSGTVAKDGWITWQYPNPQPDVVAIRITFTDLFNSGLGPFPYRAGCRDVQVLVGSGTTRPVVTTTSHKEGSVLDYTDIVKRFCAWAGLHWPLRSAVQTLSDGSTVTSPPSSSDPALTPEVERGELTAAQVGAGRAWGDFEESGTSMIVGVDLTIDIFDKKPLMDGIRYVADLLGFIFFIDETGGAVFRLPNVFGTGNWIGDGGPSAGRTTDVVVIDEKETLRQLTVQLSSKSIREKVFVGNVDGKIGAVVNGHNPYPSGLRRVGGWTDQRFQSTKECLIMADMLALRELFTYRTDSVVIPGNPAIQIDDQVQIFERVTAEGYLHYVNQIEMEWDLETGDYKYTLQTHWLGEEPFGKWVFDPANLSPDTQQYLQALGKI